MELDKQVEDEGAWEAGREHRSICVHSHGEAMLERRNEVRTNLYHTFASKQCTVCHLDIRMTKKKLNPWASCCKRDKILCIFSETGINWFLLRNYMTGEKIKICL